jgi:hypothetical protein
VNFDSSNIYCRGTDYPFAIKIAAGKINVVNQTVLVNMVLSMMGQNTWAEGYFFAWDREEKFEKCKAEFQ